MWKLGGAAPHRFQMVTLAWFEGYAIQGGTAAEAGLGNGAAVASFHGRN